MIITCAAARVKRSRAMREAGQLPAGLQHGVYCFREYPGTRELKRLEAVTRADCSTRSK